MKHLSTALALTLVGALAACSSTQGDAGTPALTAAMKWEPLQTATSACGRYKLRLENSQWIDVAGSPPQLSLQFALRHTEADVFLSRGARVTDLVTPAGATFREVTLKGHARANTSSETLHVHGLQVYGLEDRLQRLRVETRVLRVFSWTTYELKCSGPGERIEVVCAPYTVSLFSREDVPGTCSVGANITSEWRALPAHQRDLIGVLGHDWVAQSARLTDASGRTLSNHGSAGSGGFTAATYGPAFAVDVNPGAAAPSVAWPVHGTLRIPERYVVEIVPFEFIDCPLTSPPKDEVR